MKISKINLYYDINWKVIGSIPYARKLENEFAALFSIKAIFAIKICCRRPTPLHIINRRLIKRTFDGRSQPKNRKLALGERVAESFLFGEVPALSLISQIKNSTNDYRKAPTVQRETSSPSAVMKRNTLLRRTTALRRRAPTPTRNMVRLFF